MGRRRQWPVHSREQPVHRQDHRVRAQFGRKETEAAIASAEAALPAWSAKTGKERAAILLKWSQLMMQHQKDLAAIMTSEQGKPVTEAAGEIAYAASFLEWFAEEAKRIDGDVLQSPRPASACWRSSSPSASPPPSRRGTSRPP